MTILEKETNEIKIGDETESFWNLRKKIEERYLEQLKQDLNDLPKLIDFHEEIIKLCEEKIKNAVKIEI